MTRSLAAELFSDRAPTPGVASTSLVDLSLDEEHARRVLVDSLDRVLGERRVPVPEGALLLAEGEDLGGLFVVVEGVIALTRPVGDREVLHHASSTGPIVGLSALLAGRRSQFTCRALTDAVVIPVSFAELDTVLTDPATAGAFVTAMVRSLSRRHRRSVELQAEVEVLNRSLRDERDRLADALTALDTAQRSMVETARMATLGELAAGVAHELNNPISVIVRGVDHLVADVTALLGDDTGSLGGDVDVLAHLERARSARSPSTAEVRADRRRLTDAHGADMAAALLDAGITDESEAASIVSRPHAERSHVLRRLSTAWSLGVECRNLATASQRVADMVGSLRNYARPDADPVAGIDIGDQLDDTLRLFGSRLEGIEVERRWQDLPTITGWPAALQQVWSNLVSNAADALDGAGTLVISADRPRAGTVRVQVVDDGPGIAPDLLDRIFETRFTTKSGRVHFGLGLGLSLARQAVVRHGGTIDVESRPGRTCVTVTLPLDGPVTGRSPR